jgi:hypothetical protein
MIVKICPRHGSLTADMVNVDTSKTNTRFRCKQCQKEAHRAHYEKNKDKIKVAHAEYKERDREAFLQMKRDSAKRMRQKNGEKYRQKRRKNDRRYVAQMTDRYIAKLVRRGTSLKKDDIPKEVIEMKRVLLQMIRAGIQACRNPGARPFRNPFGRTRSK